MSSSETPANRHSVDSPDRPRRGGVVAVIALILAIAALGLAAWAAFRPAPAPAAAVLHGDPASRREDRRMQASDLVRRGVSLNTNLPVPGGDADVTGSLAVAANARLSLSGGGRYLLDRIDPATPTELAASARQFANTLMDIGAASIAGAQNTDPDQAARLSDADAANVKIVEACK